MSTKTFRKDMDWAADLEMLASGLAAGLGQAQAIMLVGQRGSLTWRPSFSLVSELYQRSSNLPVALAEAKPLVADFRFDLLCELLSANHQLGGSGLLPSLTQNAETARLRASSQEESMSRVRSVLGIARLGVSSPWIMCLLLSTRTENRQAYLTGSGPLVLTIGAAITILAWLLIKRTSQMPAVTRGLAS